jgi:hypothetical protein
MVPRMNVFEPEQIEAEADSLRSNDQDRKNALFSTSNSAGGMLTWRDSRMRGALPKHHFEEYR